MIKTQNTELSKEINKLHTLYTVIVYLTYKVILTSTSVYLVFNIQKKIKHYFESPFKHLHMHCTVWVASRNFRPSLSSRK